MTKPQTSFSERIKHITNPRNTYYVDGETGTFIPKRVSKQQIKKAKMAVPKPGPVGMVCSLILGGLCLMGAKYLRWHQLELRDASAEADVLMMIDFGLAAMAVFLLGSILRHTTVRHMLAQTVGIGVMLVGMHNLIWAFPDEFAQVYSRDYVEQVQTLTTPQSIYLRGATITL